MTSRSRSAGPCKTHRIRSPDVHVHTLYCTDPALHHLALQTAYSHTDTGSKALGGYSAAAGPAGPPAYNAAALQGRHPRRCAVARPGPANSRVRASPPARHRRSSSLTRDRPSLFALWALVLPPRCCMVEYLCSIHPFCVCPEREHTAQAVLACLS